MNHLQPHLSSSSSSLTSPSQRHFPSSPAPLSPSLDAVDVADVAKRMEAVQVELSTLPPSQHSDFLLTQLHSTLTSLAQAEQSAQHHHTTVLHHQQKTAHLALSCQRMQQRLTRLLDEAAGLKEDLRAVQSEVQGGHGGMNGKEGEGGEWSQPSLPPPTPSL